MPICPGFVATPHQSVFMDNPAEREKIERMHLMGIMEPEDIAAFAVFLASDEARRITGGIHTADFGLHWPSRARSISPAVFQR